MIDYIKGEVAELTPATVTIEAYGIGYLANISLNTYTALSGKKNAKVLIYESIREDAHQLYGFMDNSERSLFVLLISVSGIGPNTARMMLSSMTPNELSSAIANEDVNILKMVKGIGLKTAQRVIVDLKDKIKSGGSDISTQIQISSPVNNEAIAALVMLGFTQQASQKAVNKILKDKSGSSVEEVIKLALKIL